MREFRQFGVEVIGTVAPGGRRRGDRARRLLPRSRGLTDVTLHLNSIGDEVCRPAYRERLIAHLEPFRDQLDQDCRIAALRGTPCGCSTARSTATRTSCSPRRRSSTTSARTAPRTSLPWRLDAAGVAYVLDPRMVRGLDYYTRTAFEWISGVLAVNKAGTVNAGGRYDGLAETLGGPPTPGVGFAMGLDRVLLALEEGRAVPAARAPTCCGRAGRGGPRGRNAAGRRAPNRGCRGGTRVRRASPQGAAQDGGSCRRGVRGHRRGAGSSPAARSRCADSSTVCRSRCRATTWPTGSRSSTTGWTDPHDLTVRDDDAVARLWRAAIRPRRPGRDALRVGGTPP